ncbi:MAG: hypothetical protein F6K18_00185 [Okeania sp. SIO2C2]|uniref:hypothetical protein n=1 Tax=Okeania sp. SIO2C2 TaxID=2607787 RepID=UPI0013B7E6C3|nr:hypothetical protein [Okeania sp. SIO2C2]NEP85371.1 hypothetical protein [Okeania sp. SIO2C2]
MKQKLVENQHYGWRHNYDKIYSKIAPFALESSIDLMNKKKYGKTIYEPNF